jgi:hypothetical protein
MRVVPFTPDDSERWDELVEQAPMATFLHTRRFLSYHGDRLDDMSLLLADEDGTLRAVFPAALDPADPSSVVSHPGASYGGLVHDGRLYAEDVREALGAAFAHYTERGLRVLRYKPVPHIYHRAPSGDDVWALNALGATRVGCALSCAIDLAARRAPSSRRVRSLRKALREGVGVSEDPTLTRAFWRVLESTLERRHSTRPVHTVEEIELLRGRFPDAIGLVVGLLDGEVVAGIVLFRTPRVSHIQYMASSERGMEVGALDAVAERCLELAEGEGARYFDFGTSMEDRGDRLQSGLHRFKAEFGGGGVMHECYEQALEV